MFIVIIPTPDFVNGECRAEVYADSIPGLQKEVREFIMLHNYGASDVGSRFDVTEVDLPAGASHVGYITYNGKFVDGENKPASHGGDAAMLEESI